MKRLMKRFEDLMIAITFAEAGEYDTCKEILNNETGKDQAPASDTSAQLKTVMGSTEDFE